MTKEATKTPSPAGDPGKSPALPRVASSNKISPMPPRREASKAGADLELQDVDSKASTTASRQSLSPPPGYKESLSPLPGDQGDGKDGTADPPKQAWDGKSEGESAKPADAQSAVISLPGSNAADDKKKSPKIGLFAALALKIRKNKQEGGSNKAGFSEDMPEPIRRASLTTQLAWEWAVPRNRVAQAPEVDIAFLDTLDKKFECPVCVQPLRYPVQFEECGHRCCSSCLPELLRVAPRCPIDQVHVDREKVYVDKAFCREIDNLGVRCSFQKRGCKWKGILRDLWPHIEDCKYSVYPCPKGCGVELEKRFINKHLQEDCPKRDVSCEFCKNTIAFEQEIEHLNVCGRFPVPCPNSCKKKDIPREEVEDHLEMDCPKAIIMCPFADSGCNIKCERRELSKHIEKEPTSHLTLVCETIVRHKKVLMDHSMAMQAQDARLKSVETKVDSLEKLYGSQLLWKIERYSDKLQEAKNGKKATIFSPPFLTGRHGYKLALSACLYGDGKARGKFMSIFVCICKSDYDALILWPFCHRLTFTLVDQCQDPSARRNVVYQIKPNTCKENKPFLGRPVGERNASFGAQKFVELATMNTLDYIRDDTIFIKVAIDSEDMVIV